MGLIAMALCTSEDEGHKGYSVYMLVAMGFFHSVMWPNIFTLAIDGLGTHTSNGSGLLMMGVFGGAVIPFCQGMLADMLGKFHLTFGLVAVAEAFVLYYAVVGHK